MLLLFFFPFLLFGVANPGFFQQFPNTHFVETGSLDGGGIAQAVEAGFTHIHSIEIVPDYYRQCQERFANHPHVHLWLGDSAHMLEKMIEAIEEPITFWLDAHWSDGPTGKGATYTPILQELDAIGRHPIKTHTILIDDVRCFGQWNFDHIPLRQVIKKIYEINPKYTITYGDGYRPRDILIARINPE